LCLERSRIDLCQHISRANILSFDESNFLELPILLGLRTITAIEGLHSA
jgi:hypothetical protein